MDDAKSGSVCDNVQNIEESIRFRTRAYDSVLEKIRQLYKLQDADMRMPLNEETDQLNAYLKQSLTSSEYKEKIQALTASNIIRPDDVGKVKETSLEIMKEYARAFFIRHQMYKRQGAEVKGNNEDTKKKAGYFYQWRHTKECLSDALINHLSNRAELKLQALGLDPISAHALHGVLIGRAVWASQEFSPVTLNADHVKHYSNKDHVKHYSTVRPQLGPLSYTRRTPEERITLLREHWKTARDKLNSSYRNVMVGSATDSGPMR